MWSQEVLIGRGLDHRLKKVFQRRRKQISLFSFEGAEALRESKEVRALAPLRRHAEPRTELVRIGVRVHPFPSRTRKLSSLPPKILGGKPPGKAGLANTKESRPAGRPAGWPFRSSSCPPRLLFSGGVQRMKNTERPVGQSGRPFDQQPRNEYGPLVKWPKTPASHAGNMGSNPVRVTRKNKLERMAGCPALLNCY